MPLILVVDKVQVLKLKKYAIRVNDSDEEISCQFLLCFLDHTYLPYYLPLHSFDVVDPVPGVVVVVMHFKHPFCPSFS